MLISNIVNLGFIFCSGIQNYFLSCITSCFGLFKVDQIVSCDIRIRVYSSCNELEFEDFPVDNTLDVFHSHLYNSSNYNTVILGLPFLTGIDDNDSQEVLKALCRTCLFNIIVLDNSCNTKPKNIMSYPATMLQVYTDAKRYADVINRALDLDLLRGGNIYGLGYSLGAQIMGQVCRLLKTPCGILYAFDPAGPFYLPESSGVTDVLPHLKLVSRADADVVVFVGCNEGVFGTPFRSGDINLQVNGGTFQPGCQALSMTCSHIFCKQIMLDSILFPGLCQARVCESKSRFDNGLCNYQGIFTLSLPPDKRYIHRMNEPVNVYMDTLNTHSCQGFYGSVHKWESKK